MSDPELSRMPYRLPPMTRGVDPQRMNWLWRLICELASVDEAEVVEALHAEVVPVDLRRVKSWTVSDREANFFPINLAEMERNVRALIAWRQAGRTSAPAWDAATEPSPFAELGDSGISSGA